NAANEIAVASFLGGEIGFLDIAPVVEKTIYVVGSRPVDNIEDITEVDREARTMARDAIAGLTRRAAFSA
ncbi:MAG: 1-deoxy-D-xylulose-5-phosphate reductoisomerase, partial [Rhodospirillales bacterium]